jgi:hypothetical protein
MFFPSNQAQIRGWLFFVFGSIAENKPDSIIFCYSFPPKNPDLQNEKKNIASITFQ